MWVSTSCIRLWVYWVCSLAWPCFTWSTKNSNQISSTSTLSGALKTDQINMYERLVVFVYRKFNRDLTLIRTHNNSVV